MMGPMIDVVVIGAGLGGLMAAAKLASGGMKVLVLEKKSLPGGTSYVFRRGGYAFPMGPLSFSFPGRVGEFLAQAGVCDKVSFRRMGFELRTPFLDIMMSHSLADLELALAAAFPGEGPGLAGFFRRLKEAVALATDMDRWHPDFRRSAGRRDHSAASTDATVEARAAELRSLSKVPAAQVLEGLIANVHLKNFLGSMGSEPPEMSLLNLALMWNIMSEEGIWFPSCGIHGLADLLRRKVAECGGEVRLSEPVSRILVRGGRAAGVVTASGRMVGSRWVVSNADYKTTFLGLLDAADIPGLDLAPVRAASYTGSEFCVYLGLDPGSRLR